MEEYASNSHKSRSEQKEAPKTEKNIQKVVSGSAKIKKKSGANKLADVFISEDISSVKSYLGSQILIPSLKDLVYKVVMGGLEMLMYGETGRAPKNKMSGTKISYSSFYNQGASRDIPNARIKTGFEYDDIIFDTRGDAEAVLNEMCNVIEEYGAVSIGDLYDLADVSTNNFNVNNYGWKNLHSASVIRLPGGGYMIKLPRAVPV